MKKEEIEKILKNKNNLIIGTILIIGVIFMLTAGEIKKSDNNTKPTVVNEEEQLGKILSGIEGAGEVDVMITHYSTSEKDIAYETKTNSTGGDKSNTESEDRKAVMTDGSPMVVKEIYPKVKGVIVVAQGADNPEVKRELTEAVTASLDVAAHRVCIYKKESGGRK